MLEKHKGRAAPEEKPAANEGNGEESSSDSEDRNDPNSRETTHANCKLKMQVEFLASDYEGGKRKGLIPRAERQRKLLEKQAEDHKKIENDPNGGALSLKDRRGDGFLNASLRSLSVAAFLRCLYGAIEFAPEYSLREEAINAIREP
jgi:hypothetical protein